VHISAKRTPFFKVGKELKEMVDGASPASSSDSPSESRTSAGEESATG
jgi:hypothetical protein